MTTSPPEPYGQFPDGGPAARAGGTLSPAPEPEGRRTRALSWQGIRTVTVLELRQRVRATRWKVALVAFCVLVGLVSALLQQAIAVVAGSDEYRFVYELILLFVLGLGLLVTPTLSSTAINGDRQAGTLAILQITRLGPAELALGKVLAGWVSALAFLVVSMPFLIWSWALSGTGFGAFVLTVVVLALLLAVVCAISLGFSALTARPAGSTVLSYLAVGTLSILCLIMFALTFPMISQERQVEVYTVPGGSGADAQCEWQTQTRTLAHTERTWWLLAVNPFVILADAATPTSDGPRSVLAEGPLGLISAGVDAARQGPSLTVDQCWTENYGPDAPEPEDAAETPHWPWGLAGHLLLGAGGLAIAIRRLAVPYRTLPKGARVA